MVDSDSEVYRTQDGDVLDLICLNHYGETSQSLHSVLEANPGLSSYDAILPAGVSIVLPTMTVNEVASIRLWD